VVDIDALIGRGGAPANGGAHAVPAPAAVAAKRWAKPAGVKPIILRIPLDTLLDLDEQVKKRKFRTTRHTWLLEAIAEKLERER
jgi:hypothetical protein